jgi:hypothetical protein
MAQNHPEAIQAVASRYPAAQGLLGTLTGGTDAGGFLGGLGKLFGN